MKRCLTVLLLLASALALTGCATPDTSWSRNAIQNWADRNFEPGMSRAEVANKLTELNVRYGKSARPFNPKSTSPSSVVHFPIPGYALPFTLITRVAPAAAVSFDFDEENNLIRATAHTGAIGP